MDMDKGLVDLLGDLKQSHDIIRDAVNDVHYTDPNAVELWRALHLIARSISRLGEAAMHNQKQDERASFGAPLHAAE